MPERAAAIAALLPIADGNPPAMVQIAKLLRADGREDEALDLLRRAMAIAPDDREVALKAGALLSDAVPKWHFTMLRDHKRLSAYDAALRHAIKPGMRVLEIGAGTGVLAMMAIRAGAAEVVTCEMNPAMAGVARETLARNGYADRVRLIGKRSDELDADSDLGGRMDLLVSEIISNDLLSEHVLPSHEHAVRHLLKPGAPVIPARGTIRVALAEETTLGTTRIGLAGGFDLSDLERLREPVRKLPVNSPALSLRSAPYDLFSFDFAAPRNVPPAKTSLLCESRGGPINGVVQWIELTLNEAATYENAPDPGRTISSWALRFVPMRQPIDTAPGQALRIRGAHTRERVLMWVDEA